MMSKKDYELIADLLRNVKVWMSSDDFKSLVAVFAAELASTNARFNADRFRKACGL